MVRPDPQFSPASNADLQTPASPPSTHPSLIRWVGLAVSLPVLAGLIDLILTLIWNQQLAQPHAASYWLVIKAVVYLPWSLFLWLVWRIWQMGLPGRWQWQGALALTLLAIHPALVGSVMLGFAVPGSEQAGLGLIYLDLLLALWLRETIVIAGALAGLLWLDRLSRSPFQQANTQHANTQQTNRISPSHLTIRSREQWMQVPIEDLYWVRAAGNYCELMTRTQTHRSRITIAELKQQLGDADFLQVHRSILVNQDQISAMHKGPQGWQLTLQDGKTLPVSRRRLAAVRESLNA